MISGYSNGRLGNFIMRVVDVQLSFPSMFIALVIVALLAGASTRCCWRW